jgi:signal transduction histidine kinase/HD-like signal output (HDOD) protein
MSDDGRNRAVSPQRLEQILRQLDALPTLSSVVVRLLHLTTDDDSSARDVVEVISADPALAAKVLKMCARSERGRSLKIASLDKAVVLMGFDAVRAACLSVQVFDLLGGAGPQPSPASAMFDRVQFWRHCLAVATLAERIAALPLCRGSIDRSETFTAGLMHDLGHLALHATLPQAYDRIVSIAEDQERSVDEVCRRLIGVDTHDVGRRIAEKWNLPTRLSESIWLHGQDAHAVPESTATLLIYVISLADALARGAHIAPRGQPPCDIESPAAALGLGADDLAKLTSGLHDEVAHRAAGLGLDEQPSERVLADSLARANEVLSRMALTRRRISIRADRQSAILQQVADFQADAASADATIGVLGSIGRSAASLIKGRCAWAFFRRINDVTGCSVHFDGLHEPTVREHALDGIDHLAASKRLLQPAQDVASVSSWCGDAGAHGGQLLTLSRDDWTAAWLISGPSIQIEAPVLRFLADQWTLTFAAAARMERSARLAEQLVQSNRRLVETRDEMMRRRAMASLGELACGAAHEFNNPLLIISAKAQLLRESISDTNQRASLLEIVSQTQRISDMVSALNELSRPLKPELTQIDVAEWLRLVVAQVEHSEQVVICVDPAAREARFDSTLIREALLELLQNARQEDSKGKIVAAAQIDPLDGRWMLRLADNGMGLSEKALAHAFDPFFSEKSAGRRTGLGLARARRIVEAHGGELTLNNRSPRGAVATLKLPQPRPSGRSSVAAA